MVTYTAEQAIQVIVKFILSTKQRFAITLLYMVNDTQLHFFRITQRDFWNTWQGGYSLGLRTEPYVSVTSCEVAKSVATHCLQLFRYNLSQLSALDFIPYVFANLWIWISWSSVSKAADRPYMMRATECPMSSASIITIWTLKRAVSIKWCFV